MATNNLSNKFMKVLNEVPNFVTDETAFPTSACSGRLYIPDVDGSKVEQYVQSYGSASTLSELVFLANSRDTRFEDQATLRPLFTQ